jgi:hypothetical protein
MRLIIDMAGCMLNGHGVKEASYYESRMSVLEGSAWHSPVDLPIHPVTRLRRVTAEFPGDPKLLHFVRLNDVTLANRPMRDQTMFAGGLGPYLQIGIFGSSI